MKAIRDSSNINKLIKLIFLYKRGEKSKEILFHDRFGYIGYLVVDLALNVDLDGQMYSHVCNRQFAILIYLFDQYHIPPALVFDIPFLAMVDFPTLIHVLLLFQLPPQSGSNMSVTNASKMVS